MEFRSRLTDGGELRSFMPYEYQEYFWYSFLLETESIPGP
jgi:hypothetical protein